MHLKTQKLSENLDREQRYNNWEKMVNWDSNEIQSVFRIKEIISEGKTIILHKNTRYLEKSFFKTGMYNKNDKIREKEEPPPTTVNKIRGLLQ